MVVSPSSSMPLTGDQVHIDTWSFHLVFLDPIYREICTAGKESITWRRRCRVTKEIGPVNPHGITLLQIMIEIQTKGKPLQLTVRFKDLSCARLIIKDEWISFAGQSIAFLSYAAITVIIICRGRKKPSCPPPGLTSRKMPSHSTLKTMNQKEIAVTGQTFISMVCLVGMPLSHS